MPRNTRFSSVLRDPSVHLRSPRLQHFYTSGPFSWLNPTRAKYHLHNHDLRDDDDKNQPPSQSDSSNPQITEGYQPAVNVAFQWRSRDNRKGRHSLLVRPVSPEDAKSAHYLTPPLTASFRQTMIGIKRMCTFFPYWDISWLVAVIFTLGSVVWCLNGFFVFLPLIRPSSEFPGEGTVAAGWMAWVGATIFEGGSWLLLLEAINENREGCFGWAIQRILEGDDGREIVKPDGDRCWHRHKRGWRKARRGRGADKSSPAKSSPTSVSDEASNEQQQQQQPSPSDSEDNQKSWIWVPTLSALKTHYLRELGFLASLAQLVGATIFWIAGFTAIPNAVPQEKTNLIKGVYWTPQVVGGTGFIVSSTLYMLETQEHWWKPAPKLLGWHLGFWNLIGAIGFTVSGAFGYPNTSWGLYQSACSTFWGSFAFLIGGLVQWYESLSKWPVELDTSEEGSQ